MQRRNRPVPIVVPPETTSHDFKLTDSGVFETGGIVVSKAGCIITKNGEPSSTTQASIRPASANTDTLRPSSRVSNTPEPPASTDTATHAAEQQRPVSGGKKATGAAATGSSADPSTADSNNSSSNQATIALDDLEELCVIGSGSSGVVKKVLHKPTGGVYVLKVINFDMGSEQVRRQVTTEVKALDGARHPHIVSYHQSYFANGALTILMEFMDGGSLWDVLQKIRVVPQHYLPELARQVLSGLSYLHDTARICHRDIKPGNLLLSSSGQLKISDFGVSSQLSNSMSRCLSWVGTVTYMSPERIRGDSYSFNTDVWSVGLLLLECATGRYPYPPEHAAGAAAGPPRLGFWELLEYIVVEPAPKLPADQFSVEFIDFLSYCLQKDPTKRPSAGLLLQHPFVTRGPRAHLSDLLKLPQAGSSRPRSAAAGGLRSSAGGAALSSKAQAGSRTSDSGVGVASVSVSSRSVTAQQTRTVAKSSSSKSSSSGSSRVTSASGSVTVTTAAAAAVAAGGARPSSAALAGKLAPYINTYQSRPVSAGAAAVVKTTVTPSKQQQQQVTKQPGTPSGQQAVQQQQRPAVQPLSGPMGQAAQQQQQSTPQRTPRLQQQVQQQSPRHTPQQQQQQARPPGLVIGQQQPPQQQQSPLRPLTQSLAAAGTPSSAGPLTALKPRNTPRKTPVAASPAKHI